MTERCPNCGTKDAAVNFTCKKCNLRFCLECGGAAAELAGRTLKTERSLLIRPLCPECGSDEFDSEEPS